MGGDAADEAGAIDEPHRRDSVDAQIFRQLRDPTFLVIGDRPDNLLFTAKSKLDSLNDNDFLATKIKSFFAK